MTAKNVSALIRKVAPTPASPITRPPSAGPITREMLMPRPLSASAGPSSFLGTSCGSTARKAGVSNAEPASSTKIRMRSVIGVTAPITVSTHRTTITAIMKICAAIRSLRRSTMSASAPAEARTGTSAARWRHRPATPRSATDRAWSSASRCRRWPPRRRYSPPASPSTRCGRRAPRANHADGGGPAFCVSATSGSPFVR